MLRLTVTFKDKTEKRLDGAISVTLDSELGVPADILRVTCPYDGRLIEYADRVSAFDGDKLVFTGQLDSITNLAESGAVITKLTARSPAAALLDNEAEPLTYIRPTSGIIINRHLKPFGLNEYECDRLPIEGILKIDKGMSHWQVLRRFCKLRSGSEPRITGTGRVYFSGAPAQNAVHFGNGMEKIPYTSLKEVKLRSKPVSVVKLKMKENGGYSSELRNPNPESKYLDRVRYVNLSSDTGSIKTAENIISSSNSGSRFITLECPVCVTDILGSGAVLDNGLTGSTEKFTVSRARYTLNSHGEKTEIKLIKEDS